MTLTPKRIVVATDFSGPSDDALDRAIEMAKPSNASIDLLHVLEPGADAFPFGVTGYGPDRPGLIGYIDRELAARMDRVTRAGLTCQKAMVEGQAAAAIVQRALDVGADLIVLGTHGRRGLAHVVLGSVAERVVRTARCPVLTVPFTSRAA